MRLSRFPIGLLRAFAADRRGTSAIEFAIHSVIYLAILAGTVDVGSEIYDEFQLNSVVAAASQYAAVNNLQVNSTNGSSLASSIAGIVSNGNGQGWANSVVVVNNGPSVTTTNGTASSSGSAASADSCYCPTGAAPNWSWGTPTACGSTCANGTEAGKYVTITASLAVTPLFPAFNFVQNGTITQSAMVQTQ